ncbi:hypothetical protein BP00DRAFT_79527 [Aspergillus indologenus CBS 114.80]|uniref:Uncharacterized protein n=1 Tax=Aspergillus indologenus CBS 114.80 TaxID=1450541 RepID=A0A2V5IZF3_9EURO|nr:hypothetical protein BP00DRAFT_79527 [Aspergillus indologenus CBS 114.80]
MAFTHVSRKMSPKTHNSFKEANSYGGGFPDAEVRSGRRLYQAYDIFVNSKHPHVKVILSNGIRPEKDDDLLRSELLVILAVMHSRLRVEAFLDHVIMLVRLCPRTSLSNLHNFSLGLSLLELFAYVPFRKVHVFHTHASMPRDPFHRDVRGKTQEYER